MDEAVVKVDSELLRKVQELMKKEKYKYSSKKQVVNLAILEFLNNNKLNNTGKKRKK